MKMEAIRVKQFGGGEGSELEFYIAGVKFSDVDDKLFIDRWSKENREGYQRITQIKKRIQRGGKSGILQYLKNQLGLFPTSILVSVREGAKFSAVKGANVGTLEIPDDSKLYVIDGMHRVEGLRAGVRENPEFNDYVLNLAIIPTQERFWELLIFHIINSRVGKVETDIAYRHMQTLAKNTTAPKWVAAEMMGTREKRAAKAAEVVDFLAEDDGSPFAGKIQFYGEEREPEHIVKDALLIRYISPLFLVFEKEIFS